MAFSSKFSDEYVKILYKFSARREKRENSIVLFAKSVDDLDAINHQITSNFEQYRQLDRVIIQILSKEMPLDRFPLCPFGIVNHANKELSDRLPIDLSSSAHLLVGIALGITNERDIKRLNYLPLELVYLRITIVYSGITKNIPLSNLPPRLGYLTILVNCYQIKSDDSSQVCKIDINEIPDSIENLCLTMNNYGSREGELKKAIIEPIYRLPNGLRRIEYVGYESLTGLDIEYKGKRIRSKKSELISLFLNHYHDWDDYCLRLQK